MATENKQNTTWVKDIKDGEFVRKGNWKVFQIMSKLRPHEFTMSFFIF